MSPNINPVIAFLVKIVIVIAKLICAIIKRMRAIKEKRIVTRMRNCSHAKSVACKNAHHDAADQRDQVP